MSVLFGALFLGGQKPYGLELLMFCITEQFHLFTFLQLLLLKSLFQCLLTASNIVFQIFFLLLQDLTVFTIPSVNLHVLPTEIQAI
jgi:hypothetical protein